MRRVFVDDDNMRLVILHLVIHDVRLERLLEVEEEGSQYERVLGALVPHLIAARLLQLRTVQVRPAALFPFLAIAFCDLNPWALTPVNAYDGGRKRRESETSDYCSSSPKRWASYLLRRWRIFMTRPQDSTRESSSSPLTYSKVA